MVAIKVVVLFALIGVASSCVSKTRKGANIESGQVDIPISLQFQKGPIPSASFSVGVNSKMNQHVGNGVYKQHQYNSGFEIQGAAVPVLDQSLKVQGLTADVDTRMSHNNKVVYLDGNPMNQDQEETQQASRPSAAVGQAQNNVRPQTAVEVDVVDRVERRHPSYEEHKQAKPNHVGGLKVEYFVAIMCSCAAVFLALIAVMIVIVKKRKPVVEQIIVQSPARHLSKTDSNIYSPEIVVDQKPPSYEGSKM